MQNDIWSLYKELTDESHKRQNKPPDNEFTALEDMINNCINELTAVACCLRVSQLEDYPSNEVIDDSNLGYEYPPSKDGESYKDHMKRVYPE